MSLIRIILNQDLSKVTLVESQNKNMGLGRSRIGHLYDE